MSTANFKVILVGEEGVGKTSIIRRFADNNFHEKVPPTAGCEVLVRTSRIDGLPVDFTIWDIAGQVHLDDFRRYYPDARGFLLVFDVTDLRSFKNNRAWVVRIWRACPKAPIVIVGNKADLPDQLVTQSALRKAEKKFKAGGSLFASAKTGEGVPNAFDLLGHAILAKKS